MTDIKDNFIQLKDDLALTGEERSVMRSELLVRMNARMAEVSFPSPYLRFFMEPARAFAAGALVLALAAGSTSALAGGALPGDTLYGVKIGVNERLERSFASSPEEKAVVDIAHAEERLTEVELLAAEGNADSSTIAEAETALALKVESALLVAEDFLDQGDQTKADGIHTRLNAALLAHADILDAQAEGLPPESKRDLRALSFAVSIVADTASESRENMEVETDREIIADVMLAREDEVGKKVQKLTEELRSDALPLETKTQLGIELDRIQADYDEGRALSEGEDYRAAGRKYEEVGRRVTRALAILASAERIENTTGKEVVVAFDGEPIVDSALMAKSASVPEAATMMMNMSVEEATTTEETAKRNATERPFQFLVRDRLDITR